MTRKTLTIISSLLFLFITFRIYFDGIQAGHASATAGRSRLLTPGGQNLYHLAEQVW